MRVALVHSYYGEDQPSGENTAVDQQATLLRRSGHEVLVVARRTDDLRSRPGYAVRAGASTATGVGPSPVRALHAFGPDVVHVHNLFPNWGRRWLSTWTGPLVTTLHNFRSVCAAGTLTRDGRPCDDCPRGTSLSAVRHACYRGSRLASVPLAIATRRPAEDTALVRRSTRVIVLSEVARRTFSDLGVAPEKLRCLPNFVPRPEARDPRVPREGWVYLGRLSAEKGLDQVLPHWPAAHALDVYGDGPLRDRVVQLAPPGVRVHGSVPTSAVSGILGRARGLVFPSVWLEGSPLVYAEALAHGVPVVAAAGSSVADDVERHGTGLVYHEPTQVAAALERVEQSWDACSASATARHREAFSPEVWLRGLLDVYADAIRSHRVATRG
ncbi:Glycosyltransferase involved in cell wall bisynthesis [Nocardioides scoriae]|uniref:Glycosyltransferase involved in cell wall bisynthesis n=1 Tax=Nocardioides scoriae TaxID=642780 RepID=A0A1H1WYM7_9ACTN|nr:glycosyltransferase family 4 protein [Nocardioides scoriae]SDT01870.1 Glycosyltransferase involved in cell wall bisynthesis [Nocardioides scoriae]